MTTGDGQSGSAPLETPATSAPSATPASAGTPAKQLICAITISRLYGSGGGEIAARLAKRLQWRLVDREVVVQVAHELGVTEQEADEKDERVEGFISRALRSMRMAYPSAEDGVPPDLVDPDSVYHEALSRVIQSEADEGRVVLVGRGAHALLASRRDVLRVQITAPLPERIVYVARREGLDERAARERIQRKDADRRRYVQTHYHIEPGDPVQYDLSINTGLLSLDDAVDLITLALERKARRLALPAAELGPGAGLSPYPTLPEDVRLPDAPPETSAAPDTSPSS
jgi:cytidylate kinase